MPDRAKVRIVDCHDNYSHENKELLVMSMRTLSMVLFGISTASFLVACGGGSSDGGGGGGISTGYFLDSAVAGISYDCAPSGQSGTTQGGGSYTYVSGDTCSFSLGAVALGSAGAGEIVTPVELVSGGTPSHNTVLNIVRLLTTADDDGDPSNGINIPGEVAAAADSWSGVDITSGTFAVDTEVVNMVADIDAAIPGRTVTLTSEVAAQSHMEATAACVYSGLYKGSWSINGGTGDWGIIVFPSLSAQGISNDNTGGEGFWSGSYNNSTNVITLSGDHAGDAGTVTSTSMTPDNISGTLDFTGSLGVTGTFNGSRYTGSPTATYRFTGFYSGGSQGVFSIDIDSAYNVTGRSYDFYDKSGETLSGTLDNSTGALTVSGMTIDASATLDLGTGGISGGSWTSGGNSGTFAGSGCKLN